MDGPRSRGWLYWLLFVTKAALIIKFPSYFVDGLVYSDSWAAGFPLDFLHIFFFLGS